MYSNDRVLLSTSSDLNEYLTPTNVAKAARFILAQEDKAFEKKYWLPVSKLRAVLRQTLQGYTSPCLPQPRLSWILCLEQELASLLRLIRMLYPLLTASTRHQLIAQLKNSSTSFEHPEKYGHPVSLPFVRPSCFKSVNSHLSKN